MPRLYEPPENALPLFEGHPEDLFTVNEVAALLKASRRSVFRWIEQRQLRAYKTGQGGDSGRGTRVRRQDVIAFLKRRQTTV